MDLIDLGAGANRTENYETFLTQLCDRLGANYASYATMNPITGSVQGYANYPTDWKQYYMNNNLHLVDPTLHRAQLSIAPVDWSRFQKDENFRAVFGPAQEFGITTRGITVPIRGPYGDRGLLSLTTTGTDDEWAKYRQSIVGELQLAAVHLHDAVMKSGILSRVLRRPNLSRREAEVLQWAAVGKSYQDIGDILNISDRTVEVHLKSAREKLGALTTAQAVGRAIGLGLIVPG